MIDKNGKLFGKVNILDLLIIIIILAAALFAMNRFGVFSTEKTAGVVEKRMMLTLYQEEVNNFAVTGVRAGDPVSESFKNISFGNVIEAQTGDPITWGADQDGRQVKTKREGYSSIKLKVEAPGTVGPSGITIGGTKYYVGQYLVVRVGTSTFYVRVESAEQINQ